MKVGDLVRTKNNPDYRTGHGIVLLVNGMKEAKIHWFDEFSDAPVDWNTIQCLEILSESW
jgi:hypothetical protein|tara:strand:+ start:392 stop:571 length:180 start_codon:yes stop_codon:yes gene_type:complete